MISLGLFAPLVHLEAAEAPVGLVNARLLSSAIEFCRESLVWNQEITEINTIDGQTGYTVDAPAGSKVVLTYQLDLDGVGITPVFELPDQFDLSGEPTAGKKINGRMALIPTPTATELPDILYDQYHEAISSGALSRLLAQPGQPWSDPNLVAYHRSIFEAGMLDAKAKAIRRFDGVDQVSDQGIQSLGVVA